ncbi:MAG: carboxylesterase family protein [Actinobacteria bacterium]|nr:carboxylesterase family protein [Actinomycetota bacterium]
MRVFATSWRHWRKYLRLSLAAGTAAAALAATGVVASGASAASGSSGGNNGGRSGSPVVGTADGFVRGSSAAGVSEFLGLPYAAPPVGNLRWQPPQPAARWSGVRAATSFAPHCPQSASPFGLASTSENCLYLNVYTPAGGARNRPVMVWIHGGALVTGESNDYNPAALVRDGVVVVTINYRLGALGFLADSALAAQPGGPSGNYGLMDQQAALRWVQRNIGGFGGDRRNVTVFGESAGGLSTLSQLVSPGAQGLFQHAIVESGTYALTQATLASAESAGAAFAAKVGCASNTAACLRSVPVSTILADQNAGAGGYQPNIDGDVLPQSIGTALSSGQFNHVPVIIGTNHDEWRLFVGLEQAEGGPAVTAANYQSMIAGTLGVSATVAAAIAAQYPLTAYASPAEALGAVGTDAIFACNGLAAEESLAKYVPTYAYEFADENAPELYLPPEGFPYGAAHASEIQYLFSLNTVAFPAMLSASQQRLAAIMKGYWTNLAKFGRPGGGWPRFSVAQPVWRDLVPPQPVNETGFAAEHHCSFWAALG